ncbi:MAG: HAD family hydrolase [Acetatifactor sp.]|nr:HAD family hydrolase [Acetatifactor sp.]
MKAIIFDAFGTLFKVTAGGSARAIINNICMNGNGVDENAFLKEWKTYYKEHTGEDCAFMTEREIFISRIRMFYDRYGVKRDAEIDADTLLAGAFEREAYPEVNLVLDKLKKKYLVCIGSNTDNNVLESVMSKNGVKVDKVYTSENLKCYKPNSRFFKDILADNSLEPQDVLFVGDSISDDILGPKDLGIKTVWIDRKCCGGDHGQDYTISDLTDLLPICGVDVL